MYHVVFHPLAADDLIEKISLAVAKIFIRKTGGRLAQHPEPDGRVIKKLQHIVVTVFFEYKVRFDWRAIFYIDERHKEVRVLGFIPKNVSRSLFDRRLDRFFFQRHRSLFPSERR